MEIRLLTQAPEPGLLAAAADAYLAAFSQPPYGEGPEHGAAFIERVERYARERDGFRLVIADAVAIPVLRSSTSRSFPARSAAGSVT